MVALTSGESENGRIIWEEKPIGFTDGIDVEG